MRFRYSKYRARPTIIDGIRFASKKEARRWQELKLLASAGDITHLRRQVAFPLWVNGELVTRYVSDFCYRTREGEDVVEDVKGVKTPVYKLKKNLLYALHRIEIKET